MNTKEILWWREFGMDSGIPECCISFWITEYIPAYGDTQSNSMLWTNFYRNQIPKHVYYIPCPNCLTNKHFVDIIKCLPRRRFPS